MSFRYQYFKKECTKCKRRILVEIGLIGVSHNAGISVTCADCIKEERIPERFKKENREAYNDIIKWIKERK